MQIITLQRTRAWLSRLASERSVVLGLALLLSSFTAQAQLSGIKTINPNGAGPNNYASFADAVAALNAGGNVTAPGGVTFNVAKMPFAENGGVPAITVSGTATAPIIFQENGLTPADLDDNPTITRSSGNATGYTDAVVTIAGGDYITFDGINVTTAVPAVEFGYLVRNASATNGASFNTIRNARVVMDRSNTYGVGVLQSSASSLAAATTGGGGFAATSAAGVNLNNVYEGLTITNAYRGIFFNTSNTAAVNYDANNVVRNCTIGSGADGDIGGGSVLSFGIGVKNQNNVTISGNVVRGVTVTGTTDAHGIMVSEVYGTANYVYSNKVSAIRVVGTSTSSTAVAFGLLLDTDNATAGTPPPHRLTAYNNFVWDLTHNYSSTVGTTLRAIGIAAQEVGTGANNFIDVYHNTVLIALPAGATATTACFAARTSATNGPVLTLRNNVFANLTGDQTGAFKHYAIHSSSATQFGKAGSTSDYNDLYVSGANGFVGAAGTASDKATLANWQATYANAGHGGTGAIDNASISEDPKFVSLSDLHVTAAELNNVGLALGSTAPGIGSDIDGQARSTTTPDLGADEYTPASDDVALLTQTAPVSGVGPGARTVTVQLQNTGLTTLTSVRVQYTLNAGSPVVQTFTGLSIAPSATGTVSFTVPATLGPVNVFELTASLPNGSADPTPTNNALTTTVYTALNGTYTINNQQPGTGNNFQSFTVAAAALNNGGVAGPVTFNVSNGPYTEQIELTAIAGVSNTNRVIFNGGGRTIRFGAEISAQRPVIRLNGTDYVTINNLVIDASNGGANPAPAYGWGIHLTNAADNNTINGCTITTVPNENGSEHAGIVASGSNTSATTAGNNVTNLTLTGNTIRHGYYGIAVIGQASLSTGLVISGNTVQDCYFHHIYVVNQNFAQVLRNDISRPTRTTLTTFTGIYFGTGGKNNRIEGNRIYNPFGGNPASTSAAYGIHFATVNGEASEPNRVVNNLLYNFNGSGTEYGLYNVNSDYAHYYHNTVVLDRTASTGTDVSAGFYQTTEAEGIDVRNNVFVLTRGGAGNRVALLFNTKTSIITSDYNDLYVGTGGNFYTGSYDNVLYAALESQPGTPGWKSAGGPGVPAAGIYDQHSVQADPSFVGTTLVPSSAVLNDAGDAAIMTVVPKDFTNGPNRTSPPDLGAYEFTPPAADVALTAFVSPLPPIGAGPRTVAVAVQNNGGTTLTSLRLAYTLNGGPAVTQNFTGLSIASGSTATVTFSAANNVTLVVGSNTLTVTASLPNGTTDANATDNTVSQTFRTALAAGTYTINSGAPTTALTGAGTNFQTFADVATVLNEGGIAGSVIFNVVAGSGPYNEQFVVGEVAGTSSSSTITLNGNGRVLTSGATAASTTTLGVLNLNGTDWVTVNNLTINATANVTAAGIRLTSAADNNTIANCTVTVNPDATAATTAGIAASGGLTVSAVGNAATNLTLLNNTVSGGYYGLSITGPNASNRGTGLTVTGNTVRDFYVYGIDIANHENPQIIGNDVSRPTRGSAAAGNTVGAFYGIYLEGVGGADVERNRIHDTFTGNPTSTSAAYGLYLSSSNGVSGATNDVVNNLLYKFNGNGTEYGIYNLDSDYARYYHNSVVLDNLAATTSSSARGFFQSNEATGIEFVNNLVSITRGGTTANSKYALYFGTATSSIYSDYNVLYIGSGTSFNTGYLGGNFATLASWKTAGGTGGGAGPHDQNSVQADPLLAAPATGNLQPSAPAVNNIGASYVVARTPDDFNGTARNATTPDPGAFEFAPTATDLAAVALLAPLDGQDCYSTPQALTVAVRNTGTAALNFATTPATVTVTVSGPVPATLSTTLTTGTLAAATTRSVTIPGTLNLNPAGTYTFTIAVSMSGDGNAANDVLTPAPTVTSVGPSAGTLSPGMATACYSEGQVLSLSAWANGNIQFQSSTTSATAGFTDIAGATSATYTTPPATLTTYYRVAVRCGTSVVYSNVATISIDNPQPASLSNDGPVCAGSTATITATKTASQSRINLYDAATGGVTLAPTSVAGNTYTFTTPILSPGTTTFYASAQTGNQENVGRPAPAGVSTISPSTYGLVFNATAPVVLTSVQVYPTGAAGNLLVQLQDNTGTVIANQAVTVAIPAGNSTAPVPFTVPLNFNVPAGTGLRLIAISGPSLVRESSVGGFPYTSPSGVVSITNGFITNPTSTNYYYFYNWQLGEGCEGSRVAVPITVTPAPAFALTPSTTQPICPGTSVSVTGTADAFYDTFTYVASPSGSTAGISQPSPGLPTATLTPTVTTTYTITATSSTAGPNACRGIRTLTVNVDVPTVGVVTPATAVVCQGGTQLLTLSAATNGSVQWQRSTTSATAGFADISGATGLTYAALPTTTTYYRAVVSCGNASSAVTSAVATLSISNPQPVSTNAPLTVCSGSTATLTVTGTTGQTFQFFSSPTSTTPLTSTTGGTSTAPTASFTTPALSAATTYYVETLRNNAETAGRATPTFTGVLGASSGMRFDVLQATTLHTVTVWSVGASGPVTIGLRNASGTVLATASGTVAAGTTATPVSTVVTLNFDLPVGTGYEIYQVTTLSLVRDNQTVAFPIVSSGGSVSITNSFSSTGYYYYFYDWRLGSSCTGARTPLQVNLTAPTILAGTQSVGTGSYCDVNVTGNVTLTGPLTVTGNLTLAAGATLNTNCQTISGPGSFTMQDGATLSVCDPAGLTLTGANGPVQVTGTRSFSPNANYIYNGTAAQVTGAGLPATVRSLTVDNPAGVTQTQALRVAQLLTLTNGNLSTSGQPLTLLSSASGTAVVVNTNGVVTGTATVQRWIDPSLNPGLGYRHYAAPVTGSTVGDLQTPGFVPVVNPAYNSAAQPGLVTPFPTVYGYDESRIATTTSDFSDFNKGWVSPGAPGEALAVAKGYTVNIAASELVDFNGTLNNGTITASGLTRGASAEAGWHLLGNPYPAPINWNALTAGDFTNLDQSVYVYRSTGQYTGQYTSFVNGIGGAQEIAIGQGFFVRATGPGPGSLRMSNAIRSTTYGSSPGFYRSADRRPLLQLDLSGAAGTDPLYVYFQQGATPGQDAGYDAVKLPNTTGLNLSAVAGLHNLAIDGLPLLEGRATVVPLFVGSPAAGTYTLTAAQLTNFDPGTVVELHDALTGTTLALSAQTSYRCTLPAGTIGGRFTLVFRPGTALATQASRDAALVSLYPNPAHGQFTLQLPALNGVSKVQATLLNALGQVVTARTLPLSANGLTSVFSTAELAAGVYSLQVKAGALTVTKRVVVE
jgi:hypothetical protein